MCFIFFGYDNNDDDHVRTDINRFQKICYASFDKQRRDVDVTSNTFFKKRNIFFLNFDYHYLKMWIRLFIVATVLVAVTIAAEPTATSRPSEI